MDVAKLKSASDVRAITPHDSNAIPVTDGISVNVSGNVVLRAVDGSSDVTLTLTAGIVYPIRAKYVRSTNTTATGIHGWYN